MSKPSVGVVFVSHRARTHLPRCLPPVLQSRLEPRVLLLNSSSDDGTVELAEDMGVETLVIPRDTFNHGASRELARKHLGTDIVVMMSPDVYAESPEFLGVLVEPIVTGAASVSYARQLPHEGAPILEQLPREYSYPEQSELRSIDDLPRLGPRLFFCSNACAAYSSSALDAIGGFPPLLALEDTIATARILRNGGKVAYVAQARVRHSHSYPLWSETRRYFDVGVVRGMYRDELLPTVGDEANGLGLMRFVVGRLVRAQPSLIPYALFQLTCRYLGYRIGFYGGRHPTRLINRLSSQDYIRSATYVWQREILRVSPGTAGGPFPEPGHAAGC